MSERLTKEELWTMLRADLVATGHCELHIWPGLIQYVTQPTPSEAPNE